jgi:hypothetical protein
MSSKIHQKLLNAKAIIEECLVELELGGDNILESKKVGAQHSTLRSKKIPTLREIVRGKKFGNGQEKVAVIVGYHETIIGCPVEKKKIEREWEDAKIVGKYRTTFLKRASNLYIRVNKDNCCDLTQTGEDFFDNFIKNEPPSETPKKPS